MRFPGVTVSRTVMPSVQVVALVEESLEGGVGVPHGPKKTNRPRILLAHDPLKHAKKREIRVRLLGLAARMGMRRLDHVVMFRFKSQGGGLTRVGHHAPRVISVKAGLKVSTACGRTRGIDVTFD
jgi:hypothetical protein